MRLFNLFNKRVTQQEGKLPFVQVFGHEKSYGAAPPQDYQKQVDNYKSWAFACAQKNAFSVAKCKLKVYRQIRDEDENEMELEEVQTHPFLDLLKNVNPFMNRLELWTITQTFLELTGNAYWWMPRDMLRTPAMIWHLPTQWVKIIPSKQNFIEGYVLLVPGIGQPVPLSVDEVVHFKFPSPFDLFYGTGPLFAAAYGIDLNTQIKTWGINFFMNNAQPSGVLYTEESLNRDSYQRLKDEWNRKYRGSENAGKIAILEAGLKYQQTGSSLKDAKFDDISRDIRDEILAMFGVPASKLGLVEDVNRANADANDYTYQKETILPRLILIEEKLNEKVMPIYDSGLICKFDSPVPEDKEFRLRERIENIRAGYSSIDDERLKDSEEPYGLPETSQPLIPFGNTITGQGDMPNSPSGNMEEEDSKKDDTEDDTEKAFDPKKKASRKRRWELFSAAVTPQEKLFAASMRRYFEAQHKEVIRNLGKFRKSSEAVTKDLAAYIIFNLDEANKNLKNRAEPYIRQAMITGMDLAARDAGAQIDWAMYEPRIMASFKERLFNFANKTNETTRELIDEEVQRGMSLGESLDQMAARIDKVFRFSEDFRSNRTAQSEVVSAVNDAQLKMLVELGYKGKMWITAKDERVRDSHQIEGQARLVEDDFITGDGNSMKYPGDKSAPIEDWINCRCNFIGIKEM